MALTDGAAHTVDSSELAFKLACQYAFRDAYNKASPTVLEPIMAVEVRFSTHRHDCLSGDGCELCANVKARAHEAVLAFLQSIMAVGLKLPVNRHP